MQHPMYEHIRQSNLIESVTDPAEIDQTIIAWEGLRRVTLGTLTHHDIKNTQRIIVANQPRLSASERGSYRDVSQQNVNVSGYHAPAYWQVPQLMDDWLHELPNKDALTAHIEFERIHPFTDGNGRTGRLLYWWHQQQLGGTPTVIRFENRLKYYQLFR